MLKDWFSWINISLLVVAALLLLIGGWALLTKSGDITLEEGLIKDRTLPTNLFSRENEDYESIGPPFLNLKREAHSLKLPDLRKILRYYGRNERPDVDIDNSPLNFGFLGSNVIITGLPNNPLYLVYDRDDPKMKYRFSEDNLKTSLWIEAEPIDDGVSVVVFMINEIGDTIREPKEFGYFPLKEQRIPLAQKEKLEIGKFKADATLLARQKVKWHGVDKFFENHGGNEYESFLGKERIDIGEGDERYVLYVGLGDAAAWKNDRWEFVEPGRFSRQYPLLVVKGIEDRVMKLELFDVEGKTKVPINLIKTMSQKKPIDIEKMFKFMGAKTRFQLVFDVKGKRLIVGPQDWLLLSDGEWKKLTTPQDLTNYIDGRVEGYLLTVDEIVKSDNILTLKGTLYNPKRTETFPIELVLSQPGGQEQGDKAAGAKKTKPPIPRKRGKEAVPVKDQDVPSEIPAVDQVKEEVQPPSLREASGEGSPIQPQGVQKESSMTGEDGVDGEPSNMVDEGN